MRSSALVAERYRRRAASGAAVRPPAARSACFTEYIAERNNASSFTQITPSNRFTLRLKSHVQRSCFGASVLSLSFLSWKVLNSFS
jgi:hypothetical protein